MIGPLLFVTALLQGAAPQGPATETPAGQVPSTGTAGGTVLLKVGDYDLDQFRSELRRGVALIEAGDESLGLAVLDKLASQSANVRRVRTLVDIERPEHGQLFVERAKGYLSTGSDKVEESLRELWRVNPFFRDPLPPRLQQTLDGMLSISAGFLDISSPVRGASFLVDGALAGRAGDLPTRVRLLAGEVEVRVKMDGYPRDGVRRVPVVAGQVNGVSLAPRQIVPPVVLLSDRPDIDIAMTGASAALKFSNLAGLRAQLPAAASQELDRRIAQNGLDANSVAGFVVPDDKIEVGFNLNLTFSGKCLVELTRTISVTEELLKANESAPLLWLGNNDNIVRPQPDVGTLRINSTPSNAEVFVNDQAVGSTPLDLTRCAGSYNLRVRHRKVGSFATMINVRRGQTVPVDVPLKPSIAFLGAVAATQTPPRAVPDLNNQIVQGATAILTTFRATEQLLLPPEVQRWNPQLAVSLVTALDRNDATQIAQLLNVANANFEAPLMVAAVRRATDNVEILFLWNEHAGVDRVRWSGQAADLERIFRGVDAPSDSADLVYQNDIGIRFADVALPGAPILIVRVDDLGSSLTVGEHIEAVDDTAMTAQGLADRIRQRKPGDAIRLRVGNVAAAPREVRVTVARKPRRAPVFDPNLQGNVLIAKLSAAGLAANPGPDRDLFNFSLAAAYLRFGEYKAASDLLQTVGLVPAGAGVGRGPALYLRARALEALGQKDAALAALKDAANIKDQIFADDGAGVGVIAERRLAVFGKTP